jgi:hypothetical protein
MATPFTVFRRYSGIMMAFFGALLMLSFVVADPLMNWMSGGNGSGAPSGGKEVAVSWNGGQLTEQQLGQLVMHRRILAQFQQAVYEIGTRSAYEAGVSEAELQNLRVQPLDLPSTSEQGVERDVVITKLVAEAATKSGMVVTNDMISDYLLNLGRSRVSKDQMRGLMSQINAGGGAKASIEFVFELLREAMLARNYQMSYAYAVSTVLPQERWADWKKFNDQITLEAVPVPVASLVSQVGEPTDAELKELFEEFKDREPSPDILRDFGNLELPSPSPAFTVPRKVAVQFVKADFQKMADDLEDDVTAEEIQKYYDDNKDLFIRADADLSAEDDATTEAADSSAEESEAVETDAAEAEAPENNSEDSDAAEAPADDAPAVETPAADAPQADDSGAASTASPFRLVALQEPAATAPGEGAAPANVAIDAPPAEEAPKTGESASEEPATEQPATEEPVAETAATDAPATETEEPAPKYQSLDEVRDQIRRRLAEEKAADAMRKLIDDAYGELNASYSDYLSAQLDAQDASAPAPQPPAALVDLKPLAEKQGLAAEKTTALSVLELQGVPLGKSLCPAYTLQRRGEDGTAQAVPQPLWYLLFVNNKVEKHQPIIAFEPESNDGYVAMVIDDTPRKTPKFEDVREQVVEAWKLRKATELALKQAQELAAKVKESGRTLKDFFANDDKVQVGVTDPFSFVTMTGMSPTTGAISLQLSNPEPLQAAGPELLKRAFELRDGEIGTALNYSRDTAYLFRVNERLRREEDMKEDFLRDGDRWFAMQLRPMIAGRQMTARNRVFGDLVRNAEIDWKRTPDAVTPGA